MDSEYVRKTKKACSRKNPVFIRIYLVPRKSNPPQPTACTLACGKVLRALRRAQGISQEDLGLTAGRDRTYVSLVELGRSSPSLDTLHVFATALGCSLVELMRRTEELMQAQAHGDRPSE